MSARKMRTDALTVSAPDAVHAPHWSGGEIVLLVSRKEKENARTMFGRGVVTLKVPHQLPDETTPYEACAGKGN